MTNSQLNRFHNVLTTRRNELERTIRNRHGIAIETSPELGEQIQQATERELALENLERESRQLREARAALDRIAHGTFGFCRDCDEPISVKRLAVLPWTPTCISCQQTADEGWKLSFNAHNDLMADVA